MPSTANFASFDLRMNPPRAASISSFGIISAPVESIAGILRGKERLLLLRSIKFQN
ncbi:MAG: hypothetical protein ACLPTZ_28620 [Beijerinckiaceae bacterium]